MHPAAKRTFWIGLFVVVFDLTWQNIPLLPNLLGYVLLAAALTQFGVYSRWFSWARIWAVGLAGAEAIRLLAGDLANPLYMSPLDPWRQISPRLGAIPLLLSAALYWCISGGFIDCLGRLGDMRLARPLRLVRVASLTLSLLNAGAVLWRTNAPRLTINIASSDVAAGGIGLIVLLSVLLVGVGEIVLWLLALRRLPGPLEAGAAQPAIAPRIVKRLTWGLLALAVVGVASLAVVRFWQTPVLHKLSGSQGIGIEGSRATWSPDGTRLAVGGTNMPARVYDSASGKVLFATADRTAYDVHDLAWSPDGSRLLSAGLGIFIDDGLTGQQIACIPGCADGAGDGWADSASWSPDGRTLALSLYEVRLFDTASMTYTQSIMTESITQSDAIRVAYSPDGALLATAGQSGQARIWTLDGQLEREILQPAGYDIRDIAWSPDGKLLAVATDYTEILIWDVRSGERVRTILLSTELDRMLQLRPHHSVNNWATTVDWSPDGRFLAAGSSDASAGVWELASGDQVLSLNGQTDLIGDIEFSPDGRRIATASHDETVWIWDTSSIYR
jgi:WD40 repeat protein